MGGGARSKRAAASETAISSGSASVPGTRSGPISTSRSSASPSGILLVATIMMSGARSRSAAIEVRDVVEHVFAVVERDDQSAAQRAHRRWRRRRRHRSGRSPSASAIVDELASADRCQWYEPRSGRHVGVGTSEQFFGESGLAHATRPDQCHEAARSNEPLQLGEFGRAADEGVVAHGHVVRVRKSRDGLGRIVARADGRVRRSNAPPQLAKLVARDQSDLGELVVRSLIGAQRHRPSGYRGTARRRGVATGPRGTGRRQLPPPTRRPTPARHRARVPFGRAVEPPPAFFRQHGAGSDREWHVRQIPERTTRPLGQGRPERFDHGRRSSLFDSVAGCPGPGHDNGRRRSHRARPAGHSHPW